MDLIDATADRADAGENLAFDREEVGVGGEEFEAAWYADGQANDSSVGLDYEMVGHLVSRFKPRSNRAEARKRGNASDQSGSWPIGILLRKMPHGWTVFRPESPRSDLLASERRPRA